MVPRLLAVARMATSSPRMRAAGFGAVSPWLQSAGRRDNGLAVLVEAGDLRDLVERAVTLSYLISADQDTLKRLEVARKRAVQLHDGMIEAEQARSAAEATVRGELAEIERVRALRKQAKEKLDARVARLAGGADACAAGRPSCGA